MVDIMKLKEFGKTIIFFMNPIALFTYLVCLSEYIKIINKEYTKKVKLEKMIYRFNRF